MRKLLTTHHFMYTPGSSSQKSGGSSNHWTPHWRPLCSRYVCGSMPGLAGNRRDQI